MPAQGCAIQPGPLGDIRLILVRDGRPMTQEEVERLSEAQHQALEQRQHLVLQELRAVTQQQRQRMEQLATEIRQVERAMST